MTYNNIGDQKMLEDYLLNPRENPPETWEMFGRYMGEFPIRIEGKLRWSSATLMSGWQQKYHKLKVQYKGRDLYKLTERKNNKQVI